MEVIPIVSPDNLHILGYKSRDEVLFNKLWHFSSLIIPFQEGTGKLLIQVRPKGKTYEGRLDIFGGYVQKNSLTDQLINEFSSEILKKVFLETAIRESNEELKIVIDKKERFLTADDLSLLEPLAGFITDNNVIKEISSAYTLVIEKGALVTTCDEVKNNVIPTESKYYSIEELLTIYRESPNLLSSAIFRIIENYSGDKSTKTKITKIIAGCKTGKIK